MIDLTEERVRWPDSLKPEGEGERFDKEPFDQWWARCRTAMPHLHAQVAEQWVHRHWHHSDYAFLPLASLRSRLETWPTNTILAEVHYPDTLHPDFDFEQLSDLHTGHTMLERGTWDYPMLVLSTPDGFRLWGGDYPNGRYLLIEGHLRFRFLNALSCRGGALSAHEVFVLDVEP